MNPQIAFLLNKALESLRISNLESAELYVKQAQRLQSNNPHALRLHGVISIKRGQYLDALKYLNNSLKILPKNSVALSNLGNVFLELKEYSKSIDAYDRSIKIDPRYEEAWLNRGNVFFELRHYEEAVLNYDKALSLKSDYAEAYSNKGNALKELNRYEGAIASYNTALSYKPDYAEAWANKGHALHELCYLEEAIDCFDKAISLKPDFHYSNWNKSLSLLLMGDFQRGLPLYESRWASTQTCAEEDRRFFREPTWLGNEPLQGKKILLYGEQGLGDFIQFSRYAKLVSDLGAEVILEVPKALANLMENFTGVSRLLVKGQEIPLFDYQCPLLSLPFALKTNANSIPSYSSYISKNQKKITEWRFKLGEKRKKRVGLVWSSMSGFKLDSKRSLTLRDFVKALPSDGFEYICLQKELKNSDKDFFKEYKNIRFFGDELNDFSDTAALIECLDLVISTCTSIPHLSAALGKRTWVLLSYVPDWRWLLDRMDSPWYPSIKLYRQLEVNNWSNVLERVNIDLRLIK